MQMRPGNNKNQEFFFFKSLFKDFKPVCGADGKTYINDCIRKCKKVKRKHKGRCRDPRTLDYRDTSNLNSTHFSLVPNDYS